MHMIRNTILQNKRWRHVFEYGLWIAHGNKIGLPLLPELTITSSICATTPEKPMWAGTNANLSYSDSIARKPTPRRRYIHRKPVNVSGNWWQFSLVVSLPLVHSALHTMNQCYDRIPILYEGQIQFFDPIIRQTHPAANIQNCTDRIKNLFQFDMEQEDSW